MQVADLEPQVLASIFRLSTDVCLVAYQILLDLQQAWHVFHLRLARDVKNVPSEPYSLFPTKNIIYTLLRAHLWKRVTFQTNCLKKSTSAH